MLRGTSTAQNLSEGKEKDPDVWKYKRSLFGMRIHLKAAVFVVVIVSASVFVYEMTAPRRGSRPDQIEGKGFIREAWIRKMMEEVKKKEADEKIFWPDLEDSSNEEASTPSFIDEDDADDVDYLPQTDLDDDFTSLNDRMGAYDTSDQNSDDSDAFVQDEGRQYDQFDQQEPGRYGQNGQLDHRQYGQIDQQEPGRYGHINHPQTGYVPDVSGQSQFGNTRYQATAKQQYNNVDTILRDRFMGGFPLKQSVDSGQQGSKPLNQPGQVFPDRQMNYMNGNNVNFPIGASGERVKSISGVRLADPLLKDHFVRKGTFLEKYPLHDTDAQSNRNTDFQKRYPVGGIINALESHPRDDKFGSLHYPLKENVRESIQHHFQEPWGLSAKASPRDQSNLVETLDRGVQSRQWLSGNHPQLHGIPAEDQGQSNDDPRFNGRFLDRLYGKDGNPERSQQLESPIVHVSTPPAAEKTKTPGLQLIDYISKNNTKNTTQNSNGSSNTKGNIGPVQLSVDAGNRDVMPQPHEEFKAVRLGPISPFVHVFSWKTPVTDLSGSDCSQMHTISDMVFVCHFPKEQGDRLSGFLRTSHTWEYETMRDIQLAILRDSLTHFIDIGASLGMFSLAVAKMSRRVVAIEPCMEHVQNFHKSAFRNSLTPYIKLLVNAISNKYEKIRVNHKIVGEGDTELSPVENGNDFVGDTIVDSITLDDLLGVVDFRRAIVKVDIPGYEYKALQKSDQFFSEMDVPKIFMHWYASMPDLDKVIDFMIDKGYKPQKSFIYDGKDLNRDELLQWNGVIVWTKN